MLKVVANYWKRCKSSHREPYPEWPLEGDISLDDEQLDCEYVSNLMCSINHLPTSALRKKSVGMVEPMLSIEDVIALQVRRGL
jgi:hypothetical protein